MNEFEALKRLRQETCPATYMPDFNKEECCDVIEKALLELKAIKEAKPSKALECLHKVASKVELADCDDYWEVRNAYAKVEQALLKAEKLEEQLGCSLEVVFKALTYGVWYEDVANRMHCIGVSLDANNYESDFVLNAYTNENAVMVRDYKKTWWLKEDKSE